MPVLVAGHFQLHILLIHLMSLPGINKLLCFSGKKKKMGKKYKKLNASTQKKRGEPILLSIIHLINLLMNRTISNCEEIVLFKRQTRSNKIESS